MSVPESTRRYPIHLMTHMLTTGCFNRAISCEGRSYEFTPIAWNREEYKEEKKKIEGGEKKMEMRKGKKT